MRLVDLFYNRDFQNRILSDLESDLERFKNVPPGLIGTPSVSPSVAQIPTTINGFFPGSQLGTSNGARELCDSLDLSGARDGPDWARIWLMLILIMVSPRIATSITSEPGAVGAAQQLWINGKTSGFRLAPFCERMHQMICGAGRGANAVTPLEIVTRELHSFYQLHPPSGHASNIRST